MNVLRLALLATAVLAGAGSASAASFDCDRTDLAPDERIICDNRDLNDADVRMVTTYKLLSGLFAMGMRGVLHDEQVEWLASRQACGADADCIRAAYAERMKRLDEVYGEIDRPI